MDLPPRNLENLKKAIDNFLQKHKLREDGPTNWELRGSILNGFGIFATRDIQCGEIIFKDSPIIFGPRHIKDCPELCVTCYTNANLRGCTKKCGLPLCSETCENSDSHQIECKFVRQFRTAQEVSKTLYQCLTPLRSLFLSIDDKEVVKNLLAHDRPEHGHEVEVLKKELEFDFKEDDEKFLRFVCAVMDANAFEVTVGVEDNQSALRGLYPLGSLANHSCYPNTTHVFNKNRQMVTRASVFIPKNSEIFHSYTRTIWGTPTRQFHLFRTKHFICKCDRCMDPTEFGTFISSILCQKCRGNLLPVNALKGSKWRCQDCKAMVSGKQVGEVLHLLGSVLQTFDNKDIKIMLHFLKGKLRTMVPETNQIILEMKCKIIWVLGHNEEFKYEGLPWELLKLKEEFCKDVLTILEKLRLGQCKFRGLMLYEYFCCKKEMQSRKGIEENNNIGKEDLETVYEEAADILRYDVTAPLEITEKWRIHDGVSS